MNMNVNVTWASAATMNTNHSRVVELDFPTLLHNTMRTIVCCAPPQQGLTNVWFVWGQSLLLPDILHGALQGVLLLTLCVFLACRLSCPPSPMCYILW